MSSRRLQDMSSRCLEDVFSVTIFRLPRRLEDVLREVLKTSSRRLQDVFVRRLQDVLEDVKLLRWRSVEDVFKTYWRPTNVCWDTIVRVWRHVLTSFEVAGGWSLNWVKQIQMSANKLGLLLHTKIMEPTILGEDPWLLCWPYENTLGWKDCKWMQHRS